MPAAAFITDRYARADVACLTPVKAAAEAAAGPAAQDATLAAARPLHCAVSGRPPTAKTGMIGHG
jgi:hypothetical protein